MSDLISRQAAINAVCSVCAVATQKTCSTIQNGDMWCKEVYTLLNLPSAEPKHGKWIYIYKKVPVFNYQCSECGARSIMFENFCSYCGARMDVND